MITRLLAAGAAAVLTVTALASCASAHETNDTGASATDTTASANALEAYGWAELAPRDLVDTLDALPVAERPADLIVSVRPDSVVVQPQQPNEQILPFEGDEFYLSIAPFAAETHPCTFHSLTTCLGELRNEPLTLTVTNADTGDTLIESSPRTADNGFVGVWLPRDLRVTVTVATAQGTGTVTTGTGPNDPTCLTTLQLT